MNRTATTLIALSFLGVALGCQKSTTDPSVGPGTALLGRIEGTVIIGPICPVQQQNVPCPTPPEAYAARKVEIYDSGHKKLLRTENIDSQGNYADVLPAGGYVLDLKKNGIDRSSDVPKSVTLAAGAGVRVDIRIDTGIR